MKDVLSDVVRHAMGLCETIKITGTADETKVQGTHESKNAFIEAYVKTPIPEFEGVFGISDMSLLKGLLDFANYRHDDAKFTVKRRVFEDMETVEQFEFKDPRGGGANFRCVNPKQIPLQPEILKINWGFELAPSKSTLAEFQQFSKLHSGVDKRFTVRTRDNNLMFAFGNENASTHNGEIVMETNVSATAKGNIFWDSGIFEKVVNLSNGTPEIKISTTQGIIGVFTETEFCHYRYYLRGEKS